MILTLKFRVQIIFVEIYPNVITLPLDSLLARNNFTESIHQKIVFFSAAQNQTYAEFVSRLEVFLTIFIDHS